jgi:hypothetical protein
MNASTIGFVVLSELPAQIALFRANEYVAAGD